MPHILIAGGVHADGLALVNSRDDVTFELIEGATEDEIIAHAREAQGIIVRTQVLTEATIEAAPDLRVVSRHGVGYDNIDLTCLNRMRIPLTITVTANAITVAEQAMSLMLALAKHVRAYDRATREGYWTIPEKHVALELHGRSLLLVGFGRTGRALASRAQAFGMRVSVCDPYVSPAAAKEAGVHLTGTLEDGLRAADVISLHAPHTPETDKLIDAAALSVMKPEAILINTARGGLIDETALAAALEGGKIAGAGLDTFVQEPPDPGNSIFRMENAIFSPHVAGVTGESLRRMGIECVRNTLDAFDGTLDPSAVVNPDTLNPS